MTAAIPVIGSGAEAIGVARQFAASIAEEVIDRDRPGAVSVRELTALDASGLPGITVPAAYGGADVPAPVLAEVVRVITGADPAIGQVLQSHFLVVDVLAVLGTPSQRHRLFGEVLAGARLGSLLTERGGHHAHDLRTRLSGRGTGTRLTGRKYGCTGALTARWIGVSALDDADRLVLAFVERDFPGVRLYDDWIVVGQHAASSGGVMFDDVPVDPCLVIPAFGSKVAAEVASDLFSRHAVVTAGTAVAGSCTADAACCDTSCWPTWRASGQWRAEGRAYSAGRTRTELRGQAR